MAKLDDFLIPDQKSQLGWQELQQGMLEVYEQLWHWCRFGNVDERCDFLSSIGFSLKLFVTLICCHALAETSIVSKAMNKGPRYSLMMNTNEQNNEGPATKSTSLKQFPSRSYHCGNASYDATFRTIPIHDAARSRITRNHGSLSLTS